MSENTANNVNYGRIVYYEPNEIFGGDNIAVSQEDLNKYVNLSVRVPSRYYNVDSFKKYDSVLRGTQFKTKKYDNEEFITFYLTDNYVDVSYNEIRNNGEISSGELFGIDSIDISFDVQFFPQVTINFTDVKGFGLMSTMEHNYEEGKINDLTAKSFFTSLFNFPYPIFTLEVKGYYGKSVSFDLSLLEFHTAFDSQTGNFKTTVKFIGHMYGVYADIPMSYLMVSPYIDYKDGNLMDTLSNKNLEPVGEVWKQLISVNSYPTYLYILRSFNKLLFTLNSGSSSLSETNNFNVIDSYVNNTNKKTKLEAIEVCLNGIINDCNTSKELFGNIVVHGETDILYIVEQGNNSTTCKIEEKLVKFKDLIELTKDEFQVYRPTVNDAVSITHTDINNLTKKYCVWHFPDITTKLNECTLEKIRTEASIETNRSGVNNVLITTIRDTMGIIPNIKNVYGILFKHLNCFSKHFYNTLENIDKNRKLSDVGLMSYETDIPSNDDALVPPFPAVYDTQNNERVIKYPGDIPKFARQEEIKLTEKIFNSINYFGARAISEISEIRRAQETTTTQITGMTGSFFVDGVDNLNGRDLNIRLKHYNIVNPRNEAFNYIYTTEDVTTSRYDSDGKIVEGARNAKISETIRDIFLSRLATFGRIHYAKNTPQHDKEYFINTEAQLLINAFPTIGADRNLLRSLKNMRVNYDNTIKDFTIKRYKNLSGGTSDGELWGFISYQPDDENNSNNLNELSNTGRIHFNANFNSKFIVYASAVTSTEAEEILNGISHHSDYKLKSEAGWGGINENYEFVYGSTKVTNDIRTFRIVSVGSEAPNQPYFIGCNRFRYTPPLSTLKNTSYRFGVSKSVIGDYDTINFLLEKYYIYNLINENILNDPNDFCNGVLGSQTVLMLRGDSNGEEKTSSILEKNKIISISESALYALEEAKNEYSRSCRAGRFGATYTFAGSAIIPISIMTAYDSDNSSQFIQVIDRETGFTELFTYNALSSSDEAIATEIDARYHVFGKCIQYDQTGTENEIDDELVWEIWDGFICKVLGVFGYSCNNTQEEIELERNRNEADAKIKTDIYYTLKTLYDKWFSGLDPSYFEMNKQNENSEYNKIHYLTTTFNDISETMIVDLESLVNQVGNTVISEDGSANSAIRFMAKIAEDNNSTFLTLPMKLNWGVNDSEIQEIFKPVSFYNGTATHDLHGVSYIVMYNGDVSHHLANERSEFVNDGYDIANYFGSEITPSPDAIRLFANDVGKEHQYKVPAFGVTYGMQNQNFFKNISVDTTNPAVTDYSIANTLLISQQGSLAGVNNSVNNVKSLYPIYANRSYTCSVEMMGCMYITPLMYFQLNNVPMFRGAYMITNVHHRITPNDFTTTFSGVRVSKYKIPINTNVISLTSLLRSTVRRGNGGNNYSNNPFTNDADLQIVLNREVFYPEGTVGRLYINGEFACFTMEPAHSGLTNCNSPGSGSIVCPNTYTITYGESYYPDGWGTTDKHLIYKEAGTYSAKTENGRELYHIYTPRLSINGNSFNDRGILMHMGNSNQNGWSRGCIILGYPSNQESSADLTNSGDTILTNLTTFATGIGDNSYGGNLTNPSKWGSFRAYKYVANIIKDAIAVGKTVKLTVNQCDNIPDPVTATTVCLMDPPSYTPSNNTGLGVCQEKYDRLVAVTDWDTFMENKGMKQIINDLVNVDLKYSTEDNFADVNMYGALTNAYVSESMTGVIENIIEKIKYHNDNHNTETPTKLIIYDAARPVLAQDFMYCLKSNNIGNKRYPAIGRPDTGNTYNGGFHQYGSAIDISIMGPDGHPLFMGSYFDEYLDNTDKVAGHMGLDAIINRITANNSNNAFKFEYSSWYMNPKLTRRGTENNNAHTYEYLYSNYYVSSITSESDNIKTFLNNYITDNNRDKIKNKCNFLNNDQAMGVLRNRALLILLARTAGLNIEDTEWWHYQQSSRTGNNLL